MTERSRVVAVGHVGIAARDVDNLAAFYRDVLGLRLGVHHPGVVAIFEVGDTDMFLLSGEPTKLEFDLASDDVDALRAELVAKDVACAPVRDEKRSGHRSFALTDPEGNVVNVVSAHPRTVSQPA